MVIGIINTLLAAAVLYLAMQGANLPL